MKSFFFLKAEEPLKPFEEVEMGNNCVEDLGVEKWKLEYESQGVSKTKCHRFTHFEASSMHLDEWLQMYATSKLKLKLKKKKKKAAKTSNITQLLKVFNLRLKRLNPY